MMKIKAYAMMSLPYVEIVWATVCAIITFAFKVVASIAVTASIILSCIAVANFIELDITNFGGLIDAATQTEAGISISSWIYLTVICSFIFSYGIILDTIWEK